MDGEQAATEQQRAVELLRQMLLAHESDIDCDACADRMDCLAELVVAGKNLDDVLTAVQRHVECCHCCQGEFDALVSILRMEQGAG
jgi:hypothetical protein